MHILSFNANNDSMRNENNKNAVPLLCRKHTSLGRYDVHAMRIHVTQFRFDPPGKGRWCGVDACIAINLLNEILVAPSVA